MTLPSDHVWAVTGAAGTIRSAVRAELSQAGVTLVSLDIVPVKPSSTSDTVLQCDVGDLTGLTAAFNGCYGVIHLGGIADEADFHDLAQVNIVGTYHVLEAARRAGVTRVIFASSNRLTGAYDVETSVSVAMPGRPDGFYGVSKVAGEALCQLYADKFALSTYAIRIGTYAPEPTSQRELRTWLSPADAMRAITAAMTAPEHHAVFYAVSHNGELWWEQEAGRAIGFSPQDTAASFGEYRPFPPGTLQGGAYATPEYSLERMRPTPPAG